MFMFVITSVLLDYFLLTLRFITTLLFLQLPEIIKTLILLFILLHIYGVAIARRGLHTATLDATSSSSLTRAEA